jgi:hypothetical protein
MMGAIGKLFHIGADLVLVSAVLAGVKRSSGFRYVFNQLYKRCSWYQSNANNDYDAFVDFYTLQSFVTCP